MDQNRLKKICEMALESRGVMVTEFRALPTHQFDHKKGEWVPDSYSLFLGIKRKVIDETSYGLRLSEIADLEGFLESLLGFECVVDFD